jgi:hypothetical protein
MYENVFSADSQGGTVLMLIPVRRQTRLQFTSDTVSEVFLAAGNRYQRGVDLDRFTEDFSRPSRFTRHMVNSISSVQASYASQVSQVAARQPQPQPAKSAPLPQDTVSLKSTGDVDHDGDSR